MIPTYTFAGKTMTLGQWAKEVGIKPITIAERIHHKWPLERALTEPVMMPAERALRRRNAVHADQGRSGDE